MQIKKVFSFLGIILITYGIITYFSLYKKQYYDKDNNNIKVKEFYQDTSIKEEIDDSENINLVNNDKIEINSKQENIIEDIPVANISIPSINLERVIYDIDSSLNDVNYNIEILKGSTMPNEISSHLFLASHSGSNYNAYFNNLSKLKIKDKIYIFYKGIKYTYEVNKIFEVDKDGKIEINGISNIKMLTLITCHIGTDKQIVVNSYLVREDIY